MEPMMEKPATAVQFTPYEISMCLYDIQRTRQWKEAIEDTVKDGDVVADAGAGTGILSVFAALDCASRIHAIEIHPRFCKLISNLAKKNGVEKKVNVIHGDATKVELPEKIDVLICELLCTGQFFEPEVQVINHLRPFLTRETSIIPRKIESFVQLLDAHEVLYGVRIDSDSRSTLLADDEPVSTRARYDEIDLTKHVEPAAVDKTVRVRARKSRIADAVVITGRAFLTDKIITERSRFLYNPEVIFLKNPVELEKDKEYDIHIAYTYGCDTLDAVVEVKPA
jgi:predicted RNA methylase